MRLIGSDGKQIGVVTKEEALKKASEENLDLIEIAPKANPPVAKLAELGKFRYQEEKRLQKQKRGSKGSDLKEVRFSPFIANHDFETRFGRVEEFLNAGNKVKTVVVFKGRQLDSKQFGYQVIQKIKERLGDTIAIDMQPKFIGRHLITVISPTKKITSKNSENKTQTEEKES